MSGSTLAVSDAAVAKLEAMKQAGRLAGSAVRVRVHEDGAAFRYELKVVGEDERLPGDAVVASPAVPLFVDPASAEHLRGATLDYVETLAETGFKFQNPNRPTLLSKPLAARVQQVLDEQVNPSVASHGGRVSLVDVEAGRVTLRFGGGCQGCGMVDVTLKHGVQEMLQKAIPEIAEVLDVTDHAAGENPYYEATS